MTQHADKEARKKPATMTFRAFHVTKKKPLRMLNACTHTHAHQKAKTQNRASGYGLSQSP